MTKERIEELLRKGMLDPDQLWDAVDELLAEREALLDAAQTVLAADGYQPLPRESHEALRAAIAKAEAE